MIFGSWKFQEGNQGNREKNQQDTTEHRLSVNPQGPPANVWHPFQLLVGAQGGYLAAAKQKIVKKSNANRKINIHIFGPPMAPNLLNLNTSTNSGSWSCELPLHLMAIWLPYGKFHGKDWQRPQSRHCGHATHLLDAYCSSPCHGLLKRPDQCPTASPETAAEVLFCPVVLCFETRSSAGERMTKIVARSHCIMRQVMVY